MDHLAVLVEQDQLRDLSGRVVRSRGFIAEQAAHLGQLPLEILDSQRAPDASREFAREFTHGTGLSRIVLPLIGNSTHSIGLCLLEAREVARIRPRSDDLLPGSRRGILRETASPRRCAPGPPRFWPKSSKLPPQARRKSNVQGAPGVSDADGTICRNIIRRPPRTAGKVDRLRVGPVHDHVSQEASHSEGSLRGSQDCRAVNVKCSAGGVLPAKLLHVLQPAGA